MYNRLKKIVDFFRIPKFNSKIVPKRPRAYTKYQYL